jgi:4-hydroxy-tetrahydrodipicolinate synthase
MPTALELPLFSGIIPALVTPFAKGEIDFKAFTRQVEALIEAGVSGLVPVGTTGETSTLSMDEHKAMVERCVAIAGGRVRVIAGAGSNSTSEMLELARHAKTVGADAVLAVVPYYNKPSQEGIYQHFKALSDTVQIPCVLYNVPSRTVADLANETVARLAKLPNIVGIKDATGEIDRISHMRREIAPDFAYLSGDDPTLIGYMAHGGHGIISVTANVAPKAMVELYMACQAGDFAKAREIQNKLIKLHKVLFADASPSPTKYALSRLGITTDEVRLPITPCAEAIRPLIDEAMALAGL